MRIAAFIASNRLRVSLFVKIDHHTPPFHIASDKKNNVIILRKFLPDVNKLKPFFML